MNHFRNFALSLLLIASVLAPTGETFGQEEASVKKNTVIVMGMIHRKHRIPGPFDLDHLKSFKKQVRSPSLALRSSRNTSMLSSH